MEKKPIFVITLQHHLCHIMIKTCFYILGSVMLSTQGV